MNKIRKSLSLKLSINILLMAVPVFVLSLGILFLQSRRMVLIGAKDRATSVLNTTLQRTNRYLKAVETATNSNEWLIIENLQPDSLLKYSRRIVQLNHDVNGCSITTEPYLFPQHGRYFSAYSVREHDSITTVRESEYEYFEKVWYKMPSTLGKPCWTEPYDDYNEGTLYTTELIVSYCKPMYDRGGKFVGVIATDLSLKQLAKAISKEQPYPNSYFMMVGKEGHFFIHPDSTKLFHETIFNNSELDSLGRAMTSGKQGNMRVYIDGKPNLASYHPVAGTEWSIALICPDSDILQSYHRLTYIVVPIIVIGLIIIMLLCRMVVAHTIKPINQLLTKTQSIAAGNNEVYIPHSKRLDAIGDLQNSFGTMLQSLNFHMGSIRYVGDQARKRNEEMVKATQLSEEADRQKNIFIQNVTHQIRTPLNIVMGFAQILQDNAELQEEEKKSIWETMRHHANALSRLIQMLYDSSETGRSVLNSELFKAASCNEVARKSIEYINYQFPALKVNFETTIPDDCCILGDQPYLIRCIRELLYNAAKYSDGQNISLHISETDGIIHFVIQDTGPGISEDYRDQMFVPFTKVDDLSEGLGLGLPLAKRHFNDMGGDLIFDSDYHEGCRFIIEMPKIS